MNYTVAVIFNDQLFHLSFPEGKSAEISASAKADIVLPDFGHTVAVIAENGTIRISDKEGKHKKNRNTEKYRPGGEASENQQSPQTSAQ